MNRLPFTVDNYRAYKDGSKTVTRRPLRGPTPPDGAQEVRYTEGMGEWSVECRLADGRWMMLLDGERPRYLPREVVALTLPHWRSKLEGVWDEVSHIYREKGGQACLTRTLDCGTWHECPAFLMPVWSCPHFAKILSARGERLQDITDADCRAEGIRPHSHAAWSYPGCAVNFDSPRRAYHAEWNALNAKRGYPWADNPWAWRYEFRLCEKPEGAK